jgi:hypothetical protein
MKAFGENFIFILRNTVENEIIISIV